MVNLVPIRRRLMPKIGSSLNDVTIEYGSTADNDVKDALVDLLKGVIKQTVAPGQTLSKVFVSATTNGEHESPRHASGQAIDISRVNGKKIGETYSSDTEVKAIVDGMQDEADKQTGIRENFGPHFKHKHKVNWTVGGHDDHIHFSVD
jgi:hypothetical protein